MALRKGARRFRLKLGGWWPVGYRAELAFADRGGVFPLEFDAPMRYSDRCLHEREFRMSQQPAGKTATADTAGPDKSGASMTPRAQDYAQWYLDVIKRADLAEHYARAGLHGHQTPRLCHLGKNAARIG